MDQKKPQIDESNVQELYEEFAHWHVNTGGETIHAKRMPGRFRTLKWITASSWLIFFLAPYLRWQGQQAILFDIPNRLFHLFGITIHPQDVWILSLVLILMAIVLFGVTAVAGRVFCGYFCFQTIWTDIFTWIEEKVEGSPQQRRKLDKAPLSFDKLRKKLIKHTLWLLISVLTGVTFAAYFTDAYQLWQDYFTLNANSVAYIVLLMFILGTYFLAGYLREQVCFWLCPYARIQGVMYDRDTILPTYDLKRGEPRGKLKAIKAGGDCIDCNMCVAVCPTGIDIRNGQQEGCITCGLCIDACDSVMEKVGKPKGLIRYASMMEMAGEHAKRLIQRPRVIIYSAIILLSISGIIYGLSTLSAIDWHILHQRQPLYIVMSDGSVQNKYTLKILNKTKDDMTVRITTEGVEGLVLSGVPETLVLKSDRLVPFDLYVRVKPERLQEEHTPITFVMQNVAQPNMVFKAQSVVVRPPR
jgi:cytochrome c oxidase accessory protein FixG